MADNPNLIKYELLDDGKVICTWWHVAGQPMTFTIPMLESKTYQLRQTGGKVQELPHA